MSEDPEKTLPENKYWARLILAEPKTELIDEVLVKRFEGGKETVAAHARRETDPADLSRKKWKFEDPQTPKSA